MKALITGASSGMGRDMANYLASFGYDLIVVSRDKKKLDECTFVNDVIQIFCKNDSINIELFSLLNIK